MAVEKRVRFKSAWLPWFLLAPQLVVILVFFFWPAGQALVQSLQHEFLIPQAAIRLRSTPRRSSPPWLPFSA